MEKRKITKEKVLISLDKELVNRLRRSKTKTSTLINSLLWKHYSPPSSLQSEMPYKAKIPSSSLGRIIKLGNGVRGVELCETLQDPSLYNSNLQLNQTNNFTIND